MNRFAILSASASGIGGILLSLVLYSASTGGDCMSKCVVLQEAIDRCLLVAVAFFFLSYTHWIEKERKRGRNHYSTAHHNE